MSRLTARTIVASVVVAGVGVAVAIWMANEGAAPARMSAGGPAQVAATPASAASTGPVRWGCHLADGKRLAVDAQVSGQIEVNYIKLRRAIPKAATSMPMGIHKADLRVGWHLEAVVTRHEGSAAVVEGDWSVRRVASDKEGADAFGDEPIGVRYLVHEDCQITDVRVQRGSKPTIMQRVGQAVSMLTFAYPAATEQETVVSELVDNAIMDTVYSLTEPSGTALRALHRGTPRPVASDRPESEIVGLPYRGLKSIQAGPKGWFTTLDGTIEARDEHKAGRASTLIHAASIAPNLRWRLRKVDYSELSLEKLVASGADADVLARIDKYRNNNLDQMFELMDQMERDGEPVHLQTAALAYWILGHQDQIPWYVDRLRRGDFDSGRRKSHATSALAQTQLPEAIKAIRSLFKDDHCDGQVRAQAFVSMGLEIRDPPMEAVDELLTIAGSATEHPGAEHMASLLAGAMASARRDSHPEVHAKVVAHLEQRLQTQHGIGLYNALKGTMNSGAEKLLPLVEKHLTSPEPEPQAAAWRALTGMPYPALEEAFPRLLSAIDGPSEHQRLFSALANAAIRGEQVPGPVVTHGALAVFAENDFAVTSPPLDIAILQLLSQVWKAKPNDPTLLGAFAGKFAAAKAGGHTQLMQSLVTLVGLDKLLKG